MFIHYKNTKVNWKCRNWSGVGVKGLQGHRQRNLERGWPSFDFNGN